MALTNAERQKNWRERCKARAAERVARIRTAYLEREQALNLFKDFTDGELLNMMKTEKPHAKYAWLLLGRRKGWGCSSG